MKLKENFIGIGIIFLIGILVLLIGFLAFPIKGYMKVESTHWIWTINIYEYQKVHKTAESRKYDSPRAAEREYDSAVRDSLPSDAYEIRGEIRESSRKVSDGENSYLIPHLAHQAKKLQKDSSSQSFK